MRKTKRSVGVLDRVQGRVAENLVLQQAGQKRTGIHIVEIILEHTLLDQRFIPAVNL